MKTENLDNWQWYIDSGEDAIFAPESEIIKVRELLKTGDFYYFQHCLSIESASRCIALIEEDREGFIIYNYFCRRPSYINKRPRFDIKPYNNLIKSNERKR